MSTKCIAAVHTHNQLMANSDADIHNNH